jgi:hypothetical protein
MARHVELRSPISRVQQLHEHGIHSRMAGSSPTLGMHVQGREGFSHWVGMVWTPGSQLSPETWVTMG